MIPISSIVEMVKIQLLINIIMVMVMLILKVQEMILLNLEKVLVEMIYL